MKLLKLGEKRSAEVELCAVFERIVGFAPPKVLVIHRVSGFLAIHRDNRLARGIAGAAIELALVSSSQGSDDRRLPWQEQPKTASILDFQRRNQSRVNYFRGRVRAIRFDARSSSGGTSRATFFATSI